jgi:hypothetical protein
MLGVVWSNFVLATSICALGGSFSSTEEPPVLILVSILV